MDMGFPAERTQFFHVSIKLGAAISGSRIADKNFYGHEDLSANRLLIESWLFNCQKGVSR